MTRHAFAIFMAFLRIAISSHVIAHAQNLNSFDYSGENASMVPIPPSERGIQTIEAMQAGIAAKNGQTLEGGLFAANGDFLFCNVSDGKVMKLSNAGALEEVLEVGDFAPGGLAWHRDGRLFVSGINQQKKNGGILAYSPAIRTIETIISTDAGYMPNDLVFDKDGGLYFSDFRGSATRPEGAFIMYRPILKRSLPLFRRWGRQMAWH